jgi:hypothetical protein
MSVPERPEPMLGHAVVRRVELGEVAHTVTEVAELPDGPLRNPPAETFVDQWRAHDQVGAWAEEPNELNGRLD